MEQNDENRVSQEQDTNDQNESFEPQASMMEEPDQDTPEVMSPLAQVFSVFTSPIGVAESIRQKPQWLIPAIVVIVATLISVVIAGQYYLDINMEAQREAMQEQLHNGDLTQDQYETALSIGTKIGQVMMYVSPVISVPFMVLVSSAILLFAGNIILGGTARFVQYWSLVFSCSLIGSVGEILRAILVVVKNGDVRGVQLGLGILTMNNMDSMAHKILAGIQVFTVWEAIVVGLGVAVLARKSAGVTIPIALLIYVGARIGLSILSGGM